MGTPRGAGERGPWTYAPLPPGGPQDIPPRRTPSSPALLSSGFLAASAPQRQHVSPSGVVGWALGDAPHSLQRQRSSGGLGQRPRVSQLRGSPRGSTDTSPERAVRHGTVLLPADTAAPVEDEPEKACRDPAQLVMPARPGR